MHSIITHFLRIVVPLLFAENQRKMRLAAVAPGSGGGPRGPSLGQCSVEEDDGG